MRERDLATRRTELEDASGDLRELCEDAAVPMAAKQYFVFFAGNGVQAAADKAPSRQSFFAGIDRFQLACEALRGTLEAAGYVPREVASVEKESARFAALRWEISAAAAAG